MERHATQVSEEERELLRDSVRGFLSTRWPVEGAVERAADPDALRAVWRHLAGQGLASLGAAGQDTGLREILLVFEEFGRAACPAPLAGAVAANLVLADRSALPDGASRFAEALAGGDAAVALVLGRWDGDDGAGRPDCVQGRVTGRAAFVEDAGTATHCLVLTDAPCGAALVAMDDPGVTVQSTPGLAVPALSDIVFDAPALVFLDASAEDLADIADLVRLGCVARALGAAQRSFDLALDHARLRRQFGQVIGQFQALQHKLADCLIRLDGARLTLESAADAYDRGDASWRVFAAAALAFAGPALRQTMLEAHHTMGAIGYAEEHELPRHFRRVHADVVRFGGAPRAREALAAHLLDGPVQPRSGG